VLPETITRKVAKFGIQPKSSAWSECQQAARAALLVGNGQVASRSREPWTIDEDDRLRASLAEGQAVRAIARHSKRATRAICRRAENSPAVVVGCKGEMTPRRLA
jgi:siroheme synthase (precorrin-2 oxidase/ferrochelatase)